MAKEKWGRGNYYKLKENWEVQPNVICGPSLDTDWIK